MFEVGHGWWVVVRRKQLDRRQRRFGGVKRRSNVCKEMGGGSTCKVSKGVR